RSHAHRLGSVPARACAAHARARRAPRGRPRTDDERLRRPHPALLRRGPRDAPRRHRAPGALDRVGHHTAARRAGALRARREAGLRERRTRKLRRAHPGRPTQGRGRARHAPGRRRRAVRLAVRAGGAAATRRAARPPAARAHRRGVLEVTYAFGSLDELGEGPGFRKIRAALGVTAFGVNGVVMAPGHEGFFHWHDTQDELYFVHRGRVEVEVEGETRVLGEGGLF